MVGVYSFKRDNKGIYIKYYKHKYYLEDLDNMNIRYIIDFNNSWIIFK